MKLLSNIKSIATAERIDTAKQYGSQALQYAKENPSDVLLGFIALALFDIEQDVDELEDILGD
jgi:hypothetical protein